MAEDLVVTTHPYCPSAIAVFERAVDALRCGSLVITDDFCWLVTSPPSGQFLRHGLRLAAAAQFGVDDWRMPKCAAFIPDFRRVVSAVHEIVEAGDAASRYRRQRDGGLAVVNGCRSQQARDGDIRHRRYRYAACSRSS